MTFHGYVLIAVHLAAILYFALNYLRFNVGLNGAESIYKSESERAISKVEAAFPEISARKVTFDRLAFILLDAWRWDFLLSADTPMTFIKE